MKLRVDLFVRTHAGGGFTAEVVGRPTLRLFHTDLAEIRETLSLLLLDEIERAHPSVQGSFTAPPDIELRTLEVPEMLWVHGPTERRAMDLSLTVLVAHRHGWTSAFVPRLDLHHWSRRSEDDWEASLLEVIEAHCAHWSDGDRLSARRDDDERLEVLELDAEPARLSDFTGEAAQLERLPERPAQRARKGEETPERPETPTLRRVGLPLHERVVEGALEPAFGRTALVERLEGLIGGPPTPVAVVGPPGSGKTALIDEVVRRACAPTKDGKKPLREAWFVDSSRLVAVRSFFDDWQRQTLDVAAEIEAVRAVWHIGSLPNLLDAGKTVSSEQNVAQLLQPGLLGRKLAVVGEASEAGWQNLEVRNPSFARCFTVVRVPEPDRAEADAIASAVTERIRSEMAVDIRPGAVELSAQLCRRHAPAEGSVFGFRLAFLRRLAASLVAARSVEGGDQPASPVTVEAMELVSAFARETGLPEDLLRDDRRLDVEELRATFEGRLIGQPRAVDRLVDLVSVLKSGLAQLGRPLGSFLFVGPTGVGKTEAAKAIAAYLFGTERRMSRFDMSELSTPGAVTRFIGDGAQEGQLVSGIRRQPFSVVLLDEIEKAHPDVFDVLLQVLGEARLTDAVGRTAAFDNAVIIMTSNLGVDTSSRGLGFDSDEGPDLERHYRGAAESFFRPELFNRIDHVVPFSPLGEVAIRRITDRELTKVVRRDGLVERGLGLDVPPEARDALASRGVDPRYGARPLKRVIEQALVAPLAERLAAKTPPPRTRITASFDESGKAQFEVTPGAGGLAAARASLSDAIEAVGQLRFRVGRWMASSDFLELAADVRLLQRLERVRAFWADPDAERRMRGVKDKRATVEAWESLAESLATLEDLGLEAWHDGDDGTLPELAREREEQLRRLEGLEMDLYDRRFDTPRKAWLVLRPLTSLRLWAELIGIYVELGRRAWTLRVSRPLEGPDGKLIWGPGQRLDADGFERARKWARKHEASDIKLSIEGDLAAATLVGEHGVINWHDGRSTETATVQSFLREPPQPPELPSVRHALRTIHEGRGIVTDHVLGISHPDEPRRYRSFARFIRARVLVEVLGDEGRAWVRRWETTS